jgi:UDP-N-acetylglucosamine 2-epimerase (non-hydrolysing)
MSDVFFEDLALPAPDVHLGVGAGTHASQTARTMLALDRALDALPHPDWVVVPGDVNSTLAAALVASKRGLRVAHLEAGLRSFDRSMPEELNRIATDHLSDLLLTPSPDADRNLAREGIGAERIVRVGNVMMDSLLEALPRARSLGVAAGLELERGGYALATLHRPSNVDDPAALERLAAALAAIARELPVVLPAHPRTRGGLARPGVAAALGAVRVLEPLGYLEFVALLDGARLVLTDSGGVQEETTALGIPCLTLRDNTERPITVEQGTNELVGTDPGRIIAAARKAMARERRARTPEGWEGKAGERVAEALVARM